MRRDEVDKWAELLSRFHLRGERDMALDIHVEAMRLKRQRSLTDAERWERLRDYIAETLVRTGRELDELDSEGTTLNVA